MADEDPFANALRQLQQLPTAAQAATPPPAPPPQPPSDPLANIQMPDWRLHDPRGMIPNITAAAQKYNIDPNVAIKVAQSEGLSTFYGDGGKSGGAFQLYTGGGYGNEFQRDTGLDPLDPKNEAQTIDYALMRASKEGWGAFHGAADVGISNWAGIKTDGQLPPSTMSEKTGPDPAPDPNADPFAASMQYMQGPSAAAAPPPGTGGGLFAGIHSGLIGMRQDLIALHALGDSILGNEEGQRNLMSVYDALDRQRQGLAPKYDSFKDLIDKGGIGDWLSTLSYKTGVLLPNIAAMITPEVGLAGLGARMATSLVARGAISAAEAAEATAKFSSWGAKIGAFLGASAQSTAGIAGEQWQATGRINPGSAISFGLLGGIPGAITPLAMASKLGLPRSLAGDFAETMSNGIANLIGGGFLQRRLGGAIGYGLEAGMAGGLQEGIARLARAWVDQNYSALGEDAASRVIEAAGTGALGGGLFGAMSPRHDWTTEINNHLSALLKGDPNFKPGADNYTKPDDPRIMKAFPESSNPALEEMQKAIRSYIVRNGGWDAMSESARKALEETPFIAENFKDIHSFLLERLNTFYKGQEFTPDDGGAPDKVYMVTPDFKKNELTFVGDAQSVKKLPLTDAPILKLTTEALDEMRKHQSMLPYDIAPKGIKDFELGRTRLGMLAGGGGKGPDWLTADYTQRGGVTDSRGRAMDITKGLQGVAFHQDLAGKPLNVRQMRFIEGIIKRYAPGAKVIIDTTGSGPASQGDFSNFGDGHYRIRLKDFGTNPYNTETAFHELGHLVAWHNWQQASFAQQMAIYAAYRKSLKDDTDSGLMDVIKHVGMGARQDIARSMTERQAGNWMRNWWNLDEFMADQFSKTIMTERSTGVNQFFDNVAGKLKQMFNDFKMQEMGFNPNANEVIADWLDGLHSHVPQAMDILANSVLKASMANGKILGTPQADNYHDQIATAPPPDSANAGIAAASAKGVVTPKVKAQADKFSRYTRWMWNSDQIATLNPHIEPLNRIVNFFKQFHADRMGTAIRADNILKAHRKLGPEMSVMLDKLLFAMDRMPWRKGNEAAGWPNQEQMRDVIKSTGMKPEHWQQIQPVYKQYVGAFSRVIDRVEEAMLARAQGISDPASRAAKIEQISHEMTALRGRPYFPHNRYGDYSVLIKDSKGKNMHFEMFPTQRQATSAAKELIARYKKDDPGADYKLDKIPEETRQWFGLPPSLLEKIHELPGITAEQHQWIDNFRYEMSPENSFSKHFMARTGIEGYDKNAQRSFANYMSSASGHLARLKYQPLIDQGLKDLSDSVDTIDPHDLASRTTRQDMATWMKHEADYILHPPNEHAAVRSFAFQWWLGFNPSTAFVHLMQMPMFTAPYMSKIYGFGSVGRMLSTAAELRGLYKDPEKFGPDYAWGQGQAHEDGFMSENRGTDMAAWAQDNLMSKFIPGTSTQHFIRETLNKTGMFMRSIERFNRLTTFRAAWKEALADPNNPHVQQLIARNELLYRQILGQGKSPEVAGAYLAARDAVQQTHFQYTQVARPKWQRGIMSPIMTFMMYKQQALWFFMHNPAGLRALAMVGATSGLAGLPGEQDLSDITKWISEKLLGTRFDPNEHIQKVAAELTGHPEDIMHGFGASGFGMPAFFGALGIPFPLGDVSRRLGYGDMVPGVAEFTRDQQESFMERFGNTVANMLGAGAEVPISIGNMLSNMNGPMGLIKALENGDWQTLRGLEPVLPSIMRNIDQATRYAVQGGDIGPKGEMRTPIDINDAHGLGEVIARGLGFAPEDVARRGRYEDMLQQNINYWTVQKQLVMNNFVNARMGKDRGSMQDTLDAIKRYNEAVPDPKMRVKAASLVRGLRDRMQKNLIAQRGGPPGMQQAILPSFPEFQQQMQRTGILPSPQSQ